MSTTIDSGANPSDRRRQMRSVATRKRILDSATRLFAERGYQATGTREIIVESGMTGGAFYHHFDDKDSVATAILREANRKVAETFSAADVGGPALEAAIRGTFAVAALHLSEVSVRVSSQLMHTIGRATGQAERNFQRWTDAFGAQLIRAQGQGDVLADVDPRTTGRSIACATYGAWSIDGLTRDGSVTDEPNLVARLAGVWDLMLPGIVVTDVAPYFRDFIRRQTRPASDALGLA